MYAGGFDGSIVEQIEMRMIRPSKFPVRHGMSPDAPETTNLQDSIRQHGLLQPILVRPLELGFEIVAGHRRFAACRSLRQRFISCKIQELSDKQAYEIQLSENLQRKTMEPLEEAEAYHRYVTEFGWGGVTDLSRKIGKSEEYVSHRMQLLKLPESVQKQVVAKNLSVSQALEVTTVSGSADRLATEIIQNNLTVRQIRQIKSEMKQEGTVARRRKETRSREEQIARKGILTLRVALSRVDNLIEDAHGADPAKKTDMIGYLMGMRQQIHAMIGETMRFEKTLKA